MAFMVVQCEGAKAMAALFRGVGKTMSGRLVGKTGMQEQEITYYYMFKSWLLLSYYNS